MRVREVQRVNLGKGEECVVRFLFGLLMIDGCVDLMLTDISSKKENLYLYRRISIKINKGHEYLPISSKLIAKTSVEFLFGRRTSADFLLTFSYHYKGIKNRKTRLADDIYIISLRNNNGIICFELISWKGLFRTSPKAVLRMLLWESGFWE